MSKKTTVYNILETSDEACDDKAETINASSQNERKTVRLI